MRKYSLRTKLSVSFIMVALFLFALVSLFANVVLKSQFEAYTVQKLHNTIEQTVALLESRVSDENVWDTAGVETIGMNALGEGLMLRIKDNTGNVVWDARVHNNGMCMQLLQHMSFNMQSYDRNFQGGYKEEAYPITRGGGQAGTVYVGYYGPYFYSDADIQFLNTLNSFLIWAAIISFAACLLFGAYTARRLAKPIERVIRATGNIARGDYHSPIKTKTSTKEIAELTDSVSSLAQTLEAQESLRKRLTADVAHELRTPLATLQSHMEAMIDGIWQPEKKRLVSCHEEILRLTKLVGELETLSRYESDSQPHKTETFDLSELLKRIILNFENGFKSRNIELVYEEKSISIEADRDKLSQVFINLISNALKFTPEGGRTEIKVSASEDTASVSVSDTGIGIPESDLPYVFERFYRTDKSRSRSTGGSGIGLTIAKSIVEAHGGSITAESEEGKGSTFTVFLPLSQSS